MSRTAPTAAQATDGLTCEDKEEDTKRVDAKIEATPLAPKRNLLAV